MPIAYIDGASGASGDMLLGALVDAGWPAATLRETLQRLPVAGWELLTERVVKRGVAATQVHFELPAGQPLRHLADLLALLAAAGLPASVHDQAARVFRALAEAEAVVHGTSVEAVHFHEVGALDTLFDVVGVVAGLAALGVERLHVGPLNVGGGTVRIAHGVVPVPPPAVALLCRGLLTYGTPAVGELLTPTGAAILATLGTAAPAQPRMTVRQVGYGAGQKELPHANVARLLIGESVAGDVASEPLVLLSCNLDDMNPEFYSFVSDQLFAAGALDVWLAPITMKKGRPAVLLSVLAAPAAADALRDLLFRETTTLGVRTLEVRRDRLERRWERVATPYGLVRVKLGLRGDAVLNRAPEYEDCAALARERGVPVKVVYAAAVAALPGAVTSTERVDLPSAADSVEAADVAGSSGPPAGPGDQP